MRGVSLCAQSQADHRNVLDRLHAMERQRLDEAFDEDVRQHTDLSADWVIEHRKGYAAGLDALALQQAASVEANAVARRNLDALDQALRRLYWLQSMQLQLTELSWPEEGGADTETRR